jgi:phage baseplate assembly protein W
MHIAYPLRITSEGLIATTDEARHIEQLIEQLIFTMPGERVNLPDFGTTLAQLVFGAANAEVIAATQFMVQGALQQWLGNLIQVQAVQVISQEATLNVTVYYVIKRTQQPQVAQFTR